MPNGREREKSLVANTGAAAEDSVPEFIGSTSVIRTKHANEDPKGMPASERLGALYVITLPALALHAVRY